MGQFGKIVSSDIFETRAAIKLNIRCDVIRKMALCTAIIYFLELI